MVTQDIDFSSIFEGLSQEDKQKMLLAMAQGMTGDDSLFIGKKKKAYSETKFSQLLADNVNFLVEREYLTVAQENLLWRIAGHLEFGTNVIIVKEDGLADGDCKAATPTHVAKLIRKSRTTASTLMNQLKELGILATTETGSKAKSGRVCTSRTWVVNPNIIICGYKHKVDPLLKRIFRDSALNKLEDENGNPIKLPVNLMQ